MKAQWEIGGKVEHKYIKNNNDIIKLIPQEKITYDEQGREIKETIYKRRNITQEVNETAKMLKLNTLTSKLNELKRNFEE